MESLLVRTMKVVEVFSKPCKIINKCKKISKALIKIQILFHNTMLKQLVWNYIVQGNIASYFVGKKHFDCT